MTIKPTKRSKRRRLPFSAYLILFLTILLLFTTNIRAEDVLLLLPKNFDVAAHKVWDRNKYTGYTESTDSQAKQVIFKFRGNKVTAGGPLTQRIQIPDVGVEIIKHDTKIEATYDKGHLSGTYSTYSHNWREGFKNFPNGEYMRSHYKGTVTGEANSDGILKITVQMTEDTRLDNVGGGWKKHNQEPNLYSWGAEFKLPVGELQSSQKFIEQKQEADDQTLPDTNTDAGDTQVEEGSETGDSAVPSDADQSVPEFTPAELAAASSLAGGAALVSALMLMGMSGVGREDIIQGIRDLLSDSKPVDSFDAWKQKYEALGWQYNAKDGVATFDPVDGCRNEEGLIWSSQKGAFVNPDAPVEPPSVSTIPKDGDVNERGEVWSTLSGGYVDRDMYNRDMESLVDIENAGRLRYNDNVYVREARTDLIEAKKAHLDSEIKLVEKTAGLLSLNLEQLQEKEAGSRFYTRDRDEFFRTTVDKAVKVMKEGKDLDKMTADLDAINDMIERQGRPVFEPQKTARDRIEDGTMRGIATVADVALTKGGMNALVSGFQTARDGILTGMSEGEALTRGTIQGAVEAATAGVGHLAGKFGMNQAIVMAGTNAAIGTATSFRDQIAQGKDILSAATRSLGDGAFAGTTSYVTDKVTDAGLERAMPYLNKAKTFTRTTIVNPLSETLQPFVDKVKPVLKVPTIFKPKVPVMDVNPEVAGKLNTVRSNITTGQNGEKILPMEDAKAIMRDSRTGRVMKPNPTEFSDVTEAHSNTIKTIKEAHDARTADALQQENPLTKAEMDKGAVSKEFKVEEFNTPGQKTTMSVDRDQRVMETLYDKDGHVISRREVPQSQWEGHSQKSFAEATNYNEGDFRKTLSVSDQQTFDGMSEGEKLKFYQEKHGWKCTDKHHIEASIDNSDQIIDPKTGQRVTASEPNIVKIKNGEATLQDAEGEGLMYKEKVRDAVASDHPEEAFAQGKKAVKTYDDVRAGYETQHLDTGKVKPGMREAMDAIKKHGDAAAQGNPEAINAINDTLRKNGFRNMNDFSDKIGSQIGSLKWAKWKGGTCGGAFYSSIVERE